MKKNVCLKSRLIASAALCVFCLTAPDIIPGTGCGVAYAQTLTVKGSVKSLQGEPLIGAAVLLKGQAQGTITDTDGKFSLSASKGQMLEVSFIGFQTKDVVVDSQVLDIILSDDTNFLDDVVVIGYGSLQRKDISSSITSVNAKDFNKGSYTSPAELLQGKVPGLVVTYDSDPNGTGSISLRGASSLREGAAMEPYYVIDGVPGVDLSLVAPEDIESIDVLRDASATAIYGSKAANGVIIVTTKKGRGEKVSVTYNGYVSFENPAKMLDVMSADELRSYAKANNFELPNDMGANTNWAKEVLRTGFTHNHNISLAGSAGKSQYSASINYRNKQGVFPNSGMERLSARSFVQTKCFNDRLEISASLNASIRNGKWVPSSNGNGESVYQSIYYFSPLCPVRNEDGTWYDGTGVVSQNYNPVAMLYENNYNGKNKFIQGVVRGALTIIDGLVWNVTASYQNHQNLYNGYDSINSQLAASASKHGLAGRSVTESSKKQLETWISYDKLFAETHKLGLMAGYSWEQDDNGDGFGLSAYNFYDDSLKYYNIGLANNIDINDIYANKLSTLRMISFYGRVNYSFDSRYILQATIRRDGSSAFGVNNRWGTFPSASFAWRAIQENFMKNQKVLSDLKFRIGYGVSGNSLGFDAYTAREIYGASGWFSYTDASDNTSRYRTIAATNNANPDLKWERTAMLNVGIDFGFLNNRITGTLEFYDKNTSDLIYWYPVSTNRYPYNTMTANVGNISNKGVELSINAIPVETRNFRWSTNFNISHNKNLVTKMSNETYSVDYVNMGNPKIGGYSNATVQRLQEGYPIGQFFVYEWAGYDEAGKSIFNDYDENGKLVGTTNNPGEDDKVAKGNAQPVVSFGWNNEFTYKNWSLTAFFNGVAGNKVYNGPRNYFSSITLVTTGKNALRSVMTDQKFTDDCAQCPSDRYLEDGSFIRLSTLQLAYNFGKLGNWVNSLQIYAIANNLFCITKYSGTDPEVSLGGLTPGIENQETRYPRTRSFLFGVNLNF